MGRCMFTKKRIAIISIFVMLVLLFTTIFFNQGTTYVYLSPKPSYTVVIDAGHGGIDGGTIGKTTNTKESDLNLIYSQKLEKQLIQAGFNVVQTRTTKDGLYTLGTKNYKKEDMQNRKDIITSANADIVISIHMNSFQAASSRGAQVFYNSSNESGKQLAISIQNQLNNGLDGPQKNASPGDYYLVKCTTTPAVIVECGFLSNPTEEQLLTNEDYQEKICYLIMCGVLNFYQINNY